MTTTIKSTATEGRTLTVHHIKDHITGDAEYLLDINDESRTSEGAIYVKVPELLDALGAVPKGTPYAELAEQLHAATQRAEAAEAKLDEIDLNPWKARAQDAAAKLRDAEATIQRVRDELARMHGMNSFLAIGHSFEQGIMTAVGQVRAILDPVPPFTLPTEAGARFTANVVKADTGSSRTFTTLVGHDAPLYAYETGNGWYTYTAEEVMSDFTDHRLLGAEDA